MLIATELRQAFRRLRFSAGFSVAAILTLTIGIGVTTALFSVFNAIVLRPLPYRDPDRLVVLWTDDVKRQLHTTLVADPLYREWKDESRSFAEMGYTTRNSPVTLTGGAEPERIDAALASASMFSTLGIAPIAGRVFSPEDEQRGERLVVLRERFAVRLFGDARDAVGKVTKIDGQPATVAGVLPEAVQFPGPEVQLWLPLSAARPRVVVLARLRDGVTLERARSEMAAIGARLASKYPELAANPDFAGFTINLVPLEQHVTGRDLSTALALLMGAVLLVLLISCANVANLLVARGAARQRELALRTALGASRGGLLRSLLVESLMLATAAGALGLALAGWLVRLVVAAAPSGLPRIDSVSIDGRVLVAALAIVFSSGISFGSVSAWQLHDLRLEEALREGGRGQSAGVRRRRLQRLLIAAELALTMTLLAGAGLLLRSLGLVERMPLGYDPRDLLAFRVVVSGSLNDAQRANFYQQAIDRLRAIAWVEDVGVTSNLFATAAPDTTILPEGQPNASTVAVADDAASAELLTALRVALRRGRLFTPSDTATSPHVAVVNEAFAQQFWPGEPAVGKRFQFGDSRFTGDPWVTIVGIVGDMRRGALEQAPFPQVFLPFAQAPSRGADLVVRTRSNPASLSHSVRAAVAAVDPAVPVYQMSTVEQRIDALLTGRRFQTWLLSLFATTALFLAGVGLYGLMRYVVSQRSHEIGVRMAMGASRSAVLSLVVCEALAPTGAGLALGLLLSAALTRGMATMLYAVTPTDPATFVIAAAVLVLAAVAACVEPAWRATRVDPVNALRHQ